jgi:hypothetical protein
MYSQKTIPYMEPNYQRSIGMVPKLKRINKPLSRKVYDLVGILLSSALIVSCASELIDKIKEYYKTRPRTEIQESARKYLDYIQNN